MRFLRPLHLIAAVVGLVACGGSARASFTLTVGATGYSTQTFTPLSGSASIGAFAFDPSDPSGSQLTVGPRSGSTFSVTDNGPGIPGLGQQTLGTTSAGEIKVINSTGSAETVTFTITDSGMFSAATGNKLTSSLNIGGLDQDFDNNTPTVELISTLVNTSGTTSIDTGAIGTVSNTSLSTLINGSGAYTLQTQFIVTLGAGADITFYGASGVTPTPAPATGLMALASLPAIGLIRGLRRRNASVATA